MKTDSPSPLCQIAAKYKRNACPNTIKENTSQSFSPRDTGATFLRKWVSCFYLVIKLKYGDGVSQTTKTAVIHFKIF